VKDRSATRVRALALSVICLLSWGLTTHGKFSATGDEPHYLMVTQSLWADRDLDVANNYASNGGALFGGGGVEPDMHARPGRTGTLLPVHDVGVSFLLIPAYVAATRLATLPSDSLLRRFRMNRGLFAYSIISCCVIALVVCAAAMTMSALEHAGLSQRDAAAIVTALWLAPPVLSDSFLVFPEPFALLATAWAVLEWTAPPRRWTYRQDAFAFVLGSLPWLHRKYTFYAAAMLAIIWWSRWRPIEGSAGLRTARAAALFVAPQLALAFWTLHYWGNLAGPLALDGLPLSLHSLLEGAPGLIVDRENGLVWWAPVYALLPAAWWLRRSDIGLWLLPIVALMIPCAAHHQWWAGFSPAGRFIVPLVPIFALSARVVLKNRTLRYAAVALLVPQIAITAYAWQHPRVFWPRGDGTNRVLSPFLEAIGQTDRWLPSFRTVPETAWSVGIAWLLLIAALNAALVVSVRRDPNFRAHVGP
jgi:hypothetical protein